MKKIYLDYNASTPLAKQVIDRMRPFLEKGFGNPSSEHWSGYESRDAIEEAREQIASMLDCSSSEIIFTSGGSESNNLAIRGIAGKYETGHIITSTIEHPAVLNVCKHLEKEGFSVTYVPVNKNGILNLNKFKKALQSNTILISIMLANNEIGTIQPLAEICEIAEKHNIPVHTDAAQAAGKINISLDNLEVDLLSIAGHKMYAPKGIGALYIRHGLEIKPLLFGADHEQGLRPGTENVLEIVGLGAAAKLFNDNSKKYIREQKKLKKYFWNDLHSALPEIKFMGDFENSLPNTLNIRFPGLDANTLLAKMPEIAASAGAACHADDINPSHVLKELGLSNIESNECIRFSLGRETTADEIDQTITKIVETVESLKNSGPLEQKQSGEKEIKLTQFTRGLGCACKLKPQNLEQIINKITNISDPNVITGIMDSEDAAIYKLDESNAIISSVDFFTPIVDDPFDFGRIAAANALSDIYAMGGTPLFALNIAAFPENRLPLSVLDKIIEGANQIAQQAGINILGGHTIDDNEPKFGLVVTGIINPARILTNKGAQTGEVLILTKPLGLGILTTALKRNLLNNEQHNRIIEIMTALNKASAQIIADYPVKCCTDITGFGLLGHLNEILTASKKQAVINFARVPYISGTRELISRKIVPGGTRANLNYITNNVNWNGLAKNDRLLLTDAQTSGGLLFTVAEKYSEEILTRLHEKNLTKSAIIGKILTNAAKKITIK